MEVEEWRDCVGFPDYMVSNEGRVRNKKPAQRILKGALNDRGYKVFNLRQDGKTRTISLHRLLAKAFIPNPQNKPFVDHIIHAKDEPKNNALSNLRWSTANENARNAHHEVGASNYPGVCAHYKGKYHAKICYEGTQISLGLFKTAEEAAEVREAVALGLFGEFHVK